MIWAAKENYNDIVTELINKNANRELTDISGETALLWATKNNNIVSVTTLVTGGGSSLDIYDTSGYTALLWAAKENFYSIII